MNKSTADKERQKPLLFRKMMRTSGQSTNLEMNTYSLNGTQEAV